MNNVGGGREEVNLFEENRGDFMPKPESLTPEMPRTVTEGEMQDFERDPRVENAMGIVSVGAAEMDENRPEMAGIAPRDNRTIEEMKIGAPEVARDGDKMERDWMERAREVIKETKNDPNERLTKVALLREEYMRKRFNRVLGARNE